MAPAREVLASPASLSFIGRGAAAQKVEILMNLIGEGFEVPNVAPALKTHSGNLNRSVTESPMLPRSSRKLRMSLHCTGGIAQMASPRWHRLKPEARKKPYCLFFLSLYQPDAGIPGLGGTECALSRSSPRAQHLQDGATRKQTLLGTEGGQAGLTISLQGLGPWVCLRLPSTVATGLLGDPRLSRYRGCYRRRVTHQILPSLASSLSDTDEEPDADRRGK